MSDISTLELSDVRHFIRSKAIGITRHRDRPSEKYRTAVGEPAADRLAQNRLRLA